jgi:hypothetical protein
MTAKKQVSSGNVESGFNLTTALVLLVMLLVVVVALLTHMLFEEKQRLIKAEIEKDTVLCIPITLTPTPVAPEYPMQPQ